MLSDELERRFLARPAIDDGTIHLIVVRTGGGAHTTPRRATLVAGGGIVGDRWADKADLDAQVTLMERRVAELVTHDAAALPLDDVQRLHAPGDNLIVDLDLSLAALPVGALLRAGTALLEVTAKPHAGCHKFRDRFGDDALRWVNAREHRARRLRGVNATIVASGEVAVGDRVIRV